MGFANRRRIWSSRSSSLWSFSAFSISALAGFLAEGFFEDIEHGLVAWAVRSALTGDYIGERGKLNPLPADFKLNGPAADTAEGACAMDAGHEIDLKVIVITNQTDQIRSGIFGPEEDGIESSRDSLQLPRVCGCSPDEEIEIDGGYWSAMQRSGCIANQDRLKLVLAKGASHGNEQR